MSLFDKLFDRPSQQAANKATETFKLLTGYSPSFTSWNGAMYESELVRAAIDARARHVSKLKVEIVGAAKPKLKNRLKHAPNTWQTWSQFLYRTSTILDCCNTCFIVPTLDEYGQQNGMFPVLPNKCELREINGRIYLRYEFTSGQRAAVLFSKCIVLTKFQYDNDFFGANNAALRETMQLIHVQNQGIEEAVKSSATYRFMAQLANFAKPEDLAAERKAFTQKNLAIDSEGGGLLLFPNTYKDIKQVTATPYTVDDKQMELIRTNVYNYFGVNEDVLQNKSYGDAWSAFYEGAIEPFAVQFSEAASKVLFTERERSEGSELVLTANRLQYLSNADKLAVSSQLADRGIMSINEIRDIWNLAPVDGGDVRTIRGEYYDADAVAEEDNNGN